MQDIHRNWPGFLAAVKVADAGSFSSAARQLNLTPAAVGKSIALLESRLGVRLFNRTTRQLSLTPEGERVVERARAALQALDEAGAVAKPDADISGLVRISCGAGYGRQFVLPAIAGILDKHPQLRVELNLSDQIVDLVKEGFDIGIRGGSEPPQGMVARRVSKVATVLVASPVYLRVRGTPQDWTELTQHRRIGLRFASGRASQWNFKVGSKTHTFNENQICCSLLRRSLLTRHYCTKGLHSWLSTMHWTHCDPAPWCRCFGINMCPGRSTSPFFIRIATAWLLVCGPLWTCW